MGGGEWRWIDVCKRLSSRQSVLSDTSAFRVVDLIVAMMHVNVLVEGCVAYGIHPSSSLANYGNACHLI